jgi:hypothetical protein
VQASAALRISYGVRKDRLAAKTLYAPFADGGMEAIRVAYNAWLRTNFQTFAGKLIDPAANPYIGDGSQVTHPENWNLTQDHLSAAGQQVLAGIVLAAIPELAEGASDVTITQNTVDDIVDGITASGISTVLLEQLAQADIVVDYFVEPVLVKWYEKGTNTLIMQKSAYDRNGAPITSKLQQLGSLVDAP